MGKSEYKVGGYTLPHYSVLMELCKSELPEDLNFCLESMLMQSYPPTDLVLVCREGLSCALKIIVKSFQNEFKDIIQIVTAGKDVSVGEALNIGMDRCRCEYIVRMDSDDISKENRCLKQMTLFAIKPELDITGTFVEEYDSDEDCIVSIKKVPVLDKEIVKYAKRRNPFNRQTVAFKKNAAQSVGGYSDAQMFEDYDLVVKMLMNGSKGQNVPEALVRYRIDKQTIKERGSLTRTKAFIRARKKFRRYGFCTLIDTIPPCAAQCILFIMPTGFTKWFYKKFLRSGK